ncbi:2-oxoglutarate dehydrogenase, E2 component, dihydrolipoamide succinyltransferase [Flaviflexus salsibiostraticola]|uniref:Dihydrolipoamide acetyltransferase component of pyruvate dehydrogenase complex n=1 Tax=Flaviflexus salsibiostraticola TaxID=1282737 RepID=A0A3S8Z6E6_9ACTO|nr:2-oxoglutarate dehydrogenase, E2 component, dihydrolipoamide succinyltransferase [Flaviflexus salsibiostraticola]AZN29055.1 2-oxoglutarate dehydrogenase, E2 component, dihydrolipoamide succinyltransferase [Flaviflexus salsibiostraticola]
MSEAIKMPALGESVTDGTVTQWLKEVGDTVEVDEPLLEVSTDKVDTEVPSPVAGVLEKIVVEEDETVEVGAILAYIGDGSGSGESDDTGEADEPAEEPAVEQSQAEEPAVEQSQAEEPAEEEAPAQKSGSSEGEKVPMPALGESVTEGTVTQWLKEVGDTVEVDEPLLEVSTDKVDTEVPSPVAGTLLEILVGEDETVEVGAALAIIGSGSPKSSEASSAPAGEDKAIEEAPSGEQVAPGDAPAEEEELGEEKPEDTADQKTDSEPKADTEDVEPVSAADSASGAYVTPIVRKLARELDVDLDSVEGTGVGGRIRRQDIEAAAEAAKKAAEEAERKAAEAASQKSAPAAPAAKAAAASPLRGTTEKMSRLRQVIAKRMMDSLQGSAQLTTVIEVDVTKVVAIRTAAKDRFHAAEGIKLTYLPFFIKAATEALKAHPKINARIVDEKSVEYFDRENVGIAVDTERGLMVPVIKNAGDLNIAGISKAVVDLASRTRSGNVSPDELSGGTFTITNTGSAGALFDTPIVNAPESAILGVGTIYKRPAVVTDEFGNESIGIRSFIYLALSYDHRLIDGADAGRYLSAVKARLEEGDFAAEVGL